jgi:hypothetical protein
MEVWFGGWGLLDVLEEWNNRAREHKLSMPDIIAGEILLVAYDTSYELDPTESLAIEEQFTAHVIAPDGKPVPDMVLIGFTDVETDTWFMDHKTIGSNITPTYINQLNQDSQAELYMMALQDIGQEPEYAIWDVVRRPLLKRRLKTPEAEREYYKRDCKGGKKGDPKPGTYLRDESWAELRARFADDVSSSPDTYLRRVKIYKSEEEIAARRYDTWATARLIQGAIKCDAFPRNEGGCNKYGGCEYIPLCWQGVDPTQSELYSIGKRKGR